MDTEAKDIVRAGGTKILKSLQNLSQEDSVLVVWKIESEVKHAMNYGGQRRLHAQDSRDKANKRENHKSSKEEKPNRKGKFGWLKYKPVWRT